MDKKRQCDTEHLRDYPDCYEECDHDECVGEEIKPMNQEIRVEAREKIAQTPIETHKYNGKRYLTLDGVNQILSLSSETDEVCYHTTHYGYYYKQGCPFCKDIGTIKKKWHIEIVEEG